MTTLTLSNASPESLKVDALLIGVAKGSKGLVLPPGAEPVDSALTGRLVATLSALGATGEEGEVTRVATLGATAAPVVVAVGLGAAPARGAGYRHETLRRAAGAAIRELAGVRRVATTLAGAPADASRNGAGTAAVAAVCEGLLIGNYAFSRYRTTSNPKVKEPVEAITVVVPDARDRAVKAAARRAEVIAEAVALCRDLVNTPPSDLHPKEFAEAAAEIAGDAGVEVEVLDERALRKGGYGGILGVGQGSTNPPRLVRLSYRPAKARKTLALVGKGITFDSGGLSLKPSPAMEWMKSDMGGAATVIAATAAIARLGLPVNVVGYAPMSENMPSGSAIRPSDVLTMYGGKRVEVLNTDAEGRLILADAIVRACEDGPDYLVDMATLTGAQLVALGSLTAAVMANDDALRERLVGVAEQAGELVWPMPLPKELRKSLDSDVADIANMGDRYGGMLVAGLFLADFVADGTPWAHIDMAGPAFNQGEPWGYTPRGGTGAVVRTIVRLAEDIAAEG
ncbi:MAG: leucyl aminopeptidase [Frankiaceae bacterium]